VANDVRRREALTPAQIGTVYVDVNCPEDND